MHYEGTVEVKKSIKEVFDFLIDPRKISTVIPDLENLEVIDENNFNIKAKVGISFIKGSMSLKFKIEEKKSPSMQKFLEMALGCRVQLI
jgi:Uncharacterized conserved protein